MRIETAKVSDPNSFVTNPGEDEKILYSGHINKRGEIVLEEVGRESMSERINAQKEFTDMDYIRTRIAAGDMSYVKDAGVYADVTKMPQTLAESLQLRLDAERAFYQLPLEIRNKFNNSLNQWLIDAGSKEWSEKMGFVEQVEQIKEDIKENVENEP